MEEYLLHLVVDKSGDDGCGKPTRRISIFNLASCCQIKYKWGI